MDIITTISEIGILETSRVTSKNIDAFSAVSPYIPAIDNDYVETNIQRLAEYIINAKKIKVFLISPEIAVLERLALSKWNGSVIIAVPFDLDVSSQERIFSNIPIGVKTEFVHEGGYPKDFRPDNGLIICTGIVPNGYRQYIISPYCRMMSVYKAFQGERILFSCFPKETNVPEIGWSYTEQDFFNQVI